MENKWLDSKGLKHLWEKITALISQKIDSVQARDRSIEVRNKREISVKISEESTNAVQLKDGLYVPKNHKLTLGEVVYDGSKDVSVPVYDGTYEP